MHRNKNTVKLELGTIANWTTSIPGLPNIMRVRICGLPISASLLGYGYIVEVLDAGILPNDIYAYTHTLAFENDLTVVV